MLRYVIRRVLITIPIIVGVAFLLFTLLHFTPGDPAEMILGSDATTEELESYREYLGLNRPYIVQLGDYLYRLFIKFDLGKSWLGGTTIQYEISLRLPRTVAISLYSILIAICTGIPMGVYAAVKQNGKFDKFVLVITSVLHCVPNYVFAMILIMVFALNLNILPAYGVNAGIASYILPCTAIFMSSFGGMARSMRTSMLEVIRSDYVMAARAQGIPRRSVYFLHALPNAMIPIITQLGGQFAHALSGTLILETIFSIPGMGLYIQGAISQRDVPVVMGSTIFLAIWFCLVMLLVDVLYAAIDPRIKAQYVAQATGKARRKKEAQA